MPPFFEILVFSKYNSSLWILARQALPTFRLTYYMYLKGVCTFQTPENVNFNVQIDIATLAFKTCNLALEPHRSPNTHFITSLSKLI